MMMMKLFFCNSETDDSGISLSLSLSLSLSVSRSVWYGPIFLSFFTTQKKTNRKGKNDKLLDVNNATELYVCGKLFFPCGICWSHFPIPDMGNNSKTFLSAV
jgi:hypothetical protein